MKMLWSVISLLLLTTLVSCGKEQFTTAPQTATETANPLTSFSSEQCFVGTTPPKVDVVYLVDNSLSSYYIASDVKNAISGTVSQLSSLFDYRIIGTPLLETASGNNDYQVLTNSTDLAGLPADSRRVSSAGQFSFFGNQPIAGSEKGLGRAVSFLNQHASSGLIRKGGYLIVIIVSNGRDQEVEDDPYGTGQTKVVAATYADRLAGLRAVKQSLSTIRMRMISATAKSVCQSGWRSSVNSYVKMANQIYADSGSMDSAVQDAYDLCSSGGVSTIFSTINESMKDLLIKHQYRYAPIPFAENSQTVSIADIQVKIRNTQTNTVTALSSSDWTYVKLPSVQAQNLREGPNPVPGPGEPVTGQHFVRFNNLVTLPNCAVVTSKSKVEYFQYIVLPQKPNPGFTVWVRGVQIPESSTNGWSDETSVQKTLNIKAAYPNAGDQYPEVIKTGFMIKLNGASNYYKSGDSIQVNYVPAPI